MMYHPMYMEMQKAKRARSARRVFWVGLGVLVALEAVLVYFAW